MTSCLGPGPTPGRGRGTKGRNGLGDRAGQALAEFVLIIPVLLLLVFGIVEFGLAFRTHQIVTNTAREGARVAVLPPSAGDPGNDARVTAVVEDRLLSAGLDPDHPEFQLVLKCDGVEGGRCSGTDRWGSLSEVELGYPYRFFVLGGLVRWACGAGCDGNFGTIQLRTAASMRNE
jgi:hypothetical protein